MILRTSWIDGELDPYWFKSDNLVASSQWFQVLAFRFRKPGTQVWAFSWLHWFSQLSMKRGHVCVFHTMHSPPNNFLLTSIAGQKWKYRVRIKRYVNDNIAPHSQLKKPSQQYRILWLLLIQSTHVPFKYPKIWSL